MKKTETPVPVTKTEQKDFSTEYIIFGIIVFAALTSVTIGYFVVSARDTPQVPMGRSKRDGKTLIALPLKTISITNVIDDLTGLPVDKATRAISTDGGGIFDIMNIKEPSNPSVRKLAQETLTRVLQRLVDLGVKVDRTKMVQLTETEILRAMDDAAQNKLPITVSLIVSVDDIKNQVVEGIQVINMGDLPDH